MGIIANWITKLAVAARLNNPEAYSVAVAEDSVTGDPRSLKATAAGLLVSFGAAVADVSVAVYHLIAPDLSSGVRSAAELSRVGDLRISADLYDHLHQSHLVVTGAITRAPLAHPCDGIWTDVDGCVVYYQPRGRPWAIVDGNTIADASKWSGANWTVDPVAHTITHAAGAVAPLTATNNPDRPIVVGKRCAFVITITGRTAGSVTINAGTQAGTARSANGTFVEVIVPATNTTITVVPSADFDGKITYLEPFVRSPKLMAKTYVPLAAVEIVGVAAGATMSTLLAASDTVEIHACYRRVPGVSDLG